MDVRNLRFKGKMKIKRDIKYEGSNLRVTQEYKVILVF